MDKITTDSIIYGVVAYKVFEPLILRYSGKKEKQCDLMEGRMRNVENRVSILETQSRNVDKKLDEIDRKLDEILKVGNK